MKLNKGFILNLNASFGIILCQHTKTQTNMEISDVKIRISTQKYFPMVLHHVGTNVSQMKGFNCTIT